MAKAAAKKKVVKKTPKVIRKRRSTRSGVNKSQAIRDYLQTSPNAGPKEVCGALAKMGIRVAPAQVSNVKTALAKKSGVRPVRRRKATSAARSSSDSVSVAALVETHQFVDKVGGIGAAKQLLATLEKLGR